MIDALCIGHAAYDITLPLDRFPAEDSKAEVAEMFEGGGGPAANAAYLLSKWGTRAAFAGIVGNDAWGERVAAEFRAANTDISLLERAADSPSPLSVILTNTATGSRTIVNRKAPTLKYRIDKDRLRAMSPRVLLFDGHELDAALTALTCCPDAASILDAGSLREGTRVLAARVNYLVASERFASQLCGFALAGRESEALQKLQELNGQTVVITLGERGLVYRIQDRAERLPAFPVKAVDTTAAGDIFHGAFAYGILKAMPLGPALELASMAAALSVTKPGGRRSIPTLAEVTEALERVRRDRSL